SVRGARAADPRLVLLAVDDKTLAGLNRTDEGDIPLTSYARMLDRLRQDRPAAIAFDTVFGEEARNAPGAAALGEAMRATGGRLVLACQNYEVTLVHEKSQVKYPELLLEPEDLKAAGVRDGYRGLPADVDDHNRRADYLVELFRPASASAEIPAKDQVFVQTFAFTVADLARGGALKKNVEELPTASHRAQGEQSKRTTWIDYVGPDTFPRVSAIDVLDGSVRPGQFAGKVVVIGVTARGNPDMYRTPLDGGGSMSDPEVQANAVDTMLRGSRLRDVSRLIDMLAILVLACVPAVASLSASRAVRVAATVGSAAVFLAVAQLAFHQGRIIAVVLPLAALVASAAAVETLLASRMVRRRGVRSRSGSVGSQSP
ncbi:MAG: CHASE2 domain-containing protein, partial [Myxococcales bacterium]